MPLNRVRAMLELDRSGHQTDEERNEQRCDEYIVEVPDYGEMIWNRIDRGNRVSERASWGDDPGMPRDATISDGLPDGFRLDSQPIHPR
jgi:hypothetical protein